MSIVITKLEKVGPVIVCSTDDPQNRTYKLDFQNGKIYGITGEPIKSTWSIVRNIPYSVSNANHDLFAALYVFVNSNRSQNIHFYHIVESLLSYPDLLPLQIDTTMIKYLCNNCNYKLPRGYVTWCRKNNKKFFADTLQEFIINHAVKNWPQPLVNSVKKFHEGTNFDLIGATDGDKDLCASLMCIINNSLKRYEFFDLLNVLKNILSILRDNPQLRPYLDDTKSLKTAYQILNDALNKERNKKILKNETKIAALNGVVIRDDLVIKVPSTMSDFTDEGEQQHNRVGYFHHESIANGRTLIYFLRHINTPDKSYITCRYEVGIHITTEHRLRNNEWFDDKNGIFDEIDIMINKILGV